MKARDITDIAIMSATLTAAKLALSMLANIELVTLLLCVYALAFGIKKSFISSIVFVLVEMLIYGANMWVIMYFIHWPIICIAVSLIRNRKYRFIYAPIIGVILTGCFGAMTTLVETIAFGGIGTGKFWFYFSARYISGVPFFITHIISNAIVLSLGIYPITNVIELILSKRQARDR